MSLKCQLWAKWQGELLTKLKIHWPLSLDKVDKLINRYNENTVSKEDLISDLQKIKLTTARIDHIVNGLQTFSHDSERDPFAPIKLSDAISKTLALCHERFKTNGYALKHSVMAEVAYCFL